MKKIFKSLVVFVIFLASIMFVKADVTDYTYEEIPDQVYSGKEIKPNVVIKLGENLLEEETDYSLSYSNNINVGDASINVVGSEEHSDLNLTLNFKINYQITYFLNGGENNNSNPSYYDGKSTIKLVKPSKVGNTFGGWFFDKKFKKKASEIKKGNVSVYAKWTPNKYNVKFNANGGKGKMTVLKNKVYGKSFKLPANKFTRKGAKFIGWNTKKDGSGISYKNKASVKNLLAKNKGTVTLYAQWEFIKYKIKYNLNGGVNNENNPLTFTINNTITLKNPTKSGYNFKGWFTDKKFKKKFTKIKKGTTKAATVYAKWSIVKYKINYELNGGTNNKNNPSTYLVTTNTINLANPTRKGYTFDGWFTESTFENSIEKIEKGSATNYSLYAKWSAIRYNVVFNGNNNDNTETTVDGIENCEYDKSFVLPANPFVKGTYVTYGWNTKADGTGESFVSGAEVKNLTAENGSTVTLYSEYRIDSTPSISRAEKRSYNKNLVRVLGTDSGKKYAVYRSLYADKGFEEVGTISTSGSYKYADYVDQDVISKKTYYYKAREYIVDNDVRIFGNYTEVSSITTAEKPKLSANFTTSNGAYYITARVSLKNLGSKDLYVGGDAIRNIANIYPYKGAIKTSAKLSPASGVVIPKNTTKSLLFVMDEKRYFSKGKTAVFTFTYDECEYITSVYDDGTGIFVAYY